MNGVIIHSLALTLFRSAMVSFLLVPGVLAAQDPTPKSQNPAKEDAGAKTAALPRDPEFRRRYEGLVARMAELSQPDEASLSAMDSEVTVLAEALSQGEAPLAAALLERWADALAKASRPDRALVVYSRAERAFVTLEDKSSAARVAIRRGAAHFALSNNEEALAAYAVAADHYERVGDAGRLADIANNRGLAYESLSRFEDALSAYNAAAEHYERVGNIGRLGVIAQNRGNLYSTLSRYEEALAAYAVAAEHFKRVGDSGRLADVAMNRGSVCSSLSRHDEALAAYAVAAEHYERVGDTERLASIAYKRGAVYFKLSRFEEALSEFSTSVERYERIKNARGVASVAAARGNMNSKFLRYEEALADYAAAAEYYDRVGDEKALADIALSRGKTYDSLSRYDDAFSEYELAAKYYERVGNADGLARLWHGRGNVYNSLSRYDEALSAYKLAAERYASLGDFKGLAAIGLGRGNVYRSLSRYEDALTAYAVAADCYQQIGDKSGLADVTLSRAGVFSALSRHGEALTAYSVAAEHYEQVKDVERQAGVAMNRGRVYALLSRYTEALAAYAVAAEYFERVGDLERLAQIALNRGRAYFRLSRYEEALAAYAEAGGHFERTGDSGGKASVSFGRGGIYFSLSRHEDALAEFAATEAHYREAGDTEALAGLAENRGVVYQSLGRHEDSLAALTEAAAYYERSGDTLALAGNAQNRGRAYYILDRYEDAFASYTQALELIATELAERVELLSTKSSGAFRAEWSWLPKAMAATALRLRPEGSSSSELALAFRALEVINGRAIAERLSAFERSPRAEDLPENERARLTTIAVERRAALKQREQILAQPANGAALSKVVARLETLSSEELQIAERWRLRNPLASQAVYPKEATPEDVIAALPARSASISLALDPDLKLAWGFALDRRGLAMVDLGDPSAIDKALRELVAHLRSSSRIEPSVSLLRGLGKLVLDPVLARLESGEARPRRLFVSLHGNLARLPIEILLTEDVAENVAASRLPRLLNQFVVSYVPSASTWLAMRKTEARARPTDGVEFFAMGFPFDLDSERQALGPTAGVEDVTDTEIVGAGVGPRGDVVLRGGHREPLPATAEEALALARTFAQNDTERARIAAAEELLDEEEFSNSRKLARIAGERFVVRLRTGAIEKALRDDPAIATARFVHLACHGEVDLTSPLLSRLVLARSPQIEKQTGDDGFVYAGELARLRFSAELLALSACETNDGTLHPTEGLQSLAHSGLLAGARSVLSTLWRVDDRAARDFMIDFYRRLAPGGSAETRADALTQAKLAAIARGAPMQTWSAYILWDAW